MGLGGMCGGKEQGAQSPPFSVARCHRQSVAKVLRRQPIAIGGLADEMFLGTPQDRRIRKTGRRLTAFDGAA
jgi:hypothetical protein